MTERTKYKHFHKGWTQEEKKYLLDALRKHGPDDLDAIHNSILTKSKPSIMKYISFYKTKAQNKIFRSRGVSSKSLPQNQDNCPINQWLKALSQHQDKLQTVLPCALELIAHLENHPDPGQNNGVDFKSLYLFLASLLVGSNFDSINDSSKAILNNTLISLSTECKFTRRLQDVEYIQNITRLFPDSTKIVSNSDQDKTKYPQPLQEIQSQFAYNPLALQLASLKRHSVNK